VRKADGFQKTGKSADEKTGKSADVSYQYALFYIYFGFKPESALLPFAR
jgi:hypothetical protein